MSNKYEKFANAIISSVKTLIDSSIRVAPFDKTRLGRVTEIISEIELKVMIDGHVYNIKKKPDTVIAVNDVVKVVIPENNYSNMFIMESSSGGGGGGGGSVTSVNGKTGTVVIGIPDIANLQTTLDSKLSNNASLSNNTTTIDVVDTRQALNSGDKMSVLFGKISKWLTDLKTIAFTGSYNDLSNKPTIPTKTSDITNDSGYITSASVPVKSVNSKTGDVVLSKADIGLGNVDNTSDANKPISTATQTALNLKEDKANKGVANGYASLDENGKVPMTQINDALIGNVSYQGLWDAETNTPTLPSEPEVSGQYWIVTTNGTQFGIDYSVGDWIIATPNGWGKVDNTDAVSSVAGRTGNVVLTKDDVGLGNVDNTSDLDKPISTATQTALNSKASTAVATTTANGLMSAGDKVKLDGLESNYVNNSRIDNSTTGTSLWTSSKIVDEIDVAVTGMLTAVEESVSLDSTNIRTIKEGEDTIIPRTKTLAVFNEDGENLEYILGEKVSSGNIVAIRRNGNEFEYTTDGTTWIVVEGGGGSDLPPYDLEDKGKVLTVNEDGTALEWDEAGSSSLPVVDISDIGKFLMVDNTLDFNWESAVTTDDAIPTTTLFRDADTLGGYLPTYFASKEQFDIVMATIESGVEVLGNIDGGSFEYQFTEPPIDGGMF